MFDPDSFVADCQRALDESVPGVAIMELLERAVSDAGSMVAALPLTRSEVVPLHVSPEITVMKVVWGPGMAFGPHDHHMWATIGIYNGAEDNEFFRRAGTTLTASGGKALRCGDVCLLGDNVIHAVSNPSTTFTGAIHIYGGDFFATPRSEWRGDPLAEEPYDVARALAYFEDANRTALQS